MTAWNPEVAGTLLGKRKDGLGTGVTREQIMGAALLVSMPSPGVSATSASGGGDVVCLASLFQHR